MKRIVKAVLLGIDADFLTVIIFWTLFLIGMALFLTRGWRMGNLYL